jgi:predicted RNase H-like HicB family nuclease
MRSYIAIVSKEPGSIWGVHFPDLPGCTSAGGTMEEAVANASKALRLWAEDETELPEATPLDDLRKRADVREDLAVGGMAVYVPLILLQRKQRYNVMLDPSLVEGIDRAARTAGVSRSDFIARAATQSLERDAGAVTIPGSQTRGQKGAEGSARSARYVRKPKKARRRA